MQTTTEPDLSYIKGKRYILHLNIDGLDTYSKRFGSEKSAKKVAAKYRKFKGITVNLIDTKEKATDKNIDSLFEYGENA